MDYLLPVLGTDEGFFRQVLAHVADAVVTTDAKGRVTYANPAAERIYATTLDRALGRSLAELLSSFRSSSGEELDEVTAVVAAQGAWHGEIAERTLDGPDVLVEASIALIYGDDGKVAGSVSVLRDISERKAAEATIAYQATHDSLTGVLNRSSLIAQLDAGIAGREQPTVVFLDLNGFKAVNDTHGHARGDEVLRIVAERLAGVVRASDLVGRFGGDEFVLVVRHLGADEAITELLERLTALFADPIRCRDGTTHTIGVSMGVARANPGDDVDHLLHRADMAMYDAKRSTEHASAYRIAR